MQSTETWKPVPGYEGMYEVSDLGNVRSLDRWSHGLRQGRILRQHVGPNGYPYVTLYDADRRLRETVHRLVLRAFVGPCPDGMEACHRDGDRANAILANLRWDTHRANLHDRVRHGRDFHAAKTRCVNGHPFTAINTRIDRKANGDEVRVCRQCHRDRNSAYKRRIREKRTA